MPTTIAFIACECIVLRFSSGPTAGRSSVALRDLKSATHDHRGSIVTIPSGDGRAGGPPGPSSAAAPDDGARTVVKELRRRLQRARWRGTGVVLCYHGICDETLPFPIWTQMPTGQFGDHLDLLSSRYDCMSLSELAARAAAGRVAGNAVAVTFDDGYANNHELAYPLLGRFGVPATIFVTVGLVGTDGFTWFDRLASLLAATSRDEIELAEGTVPTRTSADRAAAYRSLTSRLKRLDAASLDDWLASNTPRILAEDDALDRQGLEPFFAHVSWTDVEEMAASDVVTIGSHGMSHTILAVEDRERAGWEIRRSKAVLDERVGPVRDFAYPNGTAEDYGPEHRAALEEAGYRTVSTTRRGRVRGGADPLDLPRLVLGDDCTVDQLDYYLTHALG